MNAAGIDCYGVCDYEDTLPGTGFKKNALFDGVSSVIVCLIPWDTGKNEGRNMARYAVGMNYHVVGERLSYLRHSALLEEYAVANTYCHNQQGCAEQRVNPTNQLVDRQ